MALETETPPVESGPAAAAASDSGTKVFSLAEVAQHCSETDCWLTIHGKIYDVTKFMDDHPGGGDVMLNSTGRDATDDFEDIGHSSDARKMLEEYFIGVLHPEDVPKQGASAEGRPQVAVKKGQSSGSPFMLLLQILVPVAIVAFAFLVRIITAPPEASPK